MNELIMMIIQSNKKIIMKIYRRNTIETSQDNLENSSDEDKNKIYKKKNL